jgi:hypothetical protein
MFPGGAFGADQPGFFFMQAQALPQAPPQWTALSKIMEPVMLVINSSPQPFRLRAPFNTVIKVQEPKDAKWLPEELSSQPRAAHYLASVSLTNHDLHQAITRMWLLLLDPAHIQRVSQSLGQDPFSSASASDPKIWLAQFHIILLLFLAWRTSGNILSLCPLILPANIFAQAIDLASRAVWCYTCGRPGVTQTECLYCNTKNKPAPNRGGYGNSGSQASRPYNRRPDRGYERPNDRSYDRGPYGGDTYRGGRDGRDRYSERDYRRDDRAYGRSQERDRRPSDRRDRSRSPPPRNTFAQGKKKK